MDEQDIKIKINTKKLPSTEKPKEPYNQHQSIFYKKPYLFNIIYINTPRHTRQ